MRGWIQDVRFALRTLGKRPGFVVATVLILGVGLGAVTTVFTVVNAVLLAPLPYEEPGRLVEISQTLRGSDEGGLNVSVATFRDLRARTHSFESMAVFSQDTATLARADYPERIAVFAVSADFWHVLGTSLAMGSFPGGSSSTSSVLLDHGLWRRRFNSDPAVVGQAVRLDQRPVSVAGVLPVAFRFHAPPRYPQVDAFISLDEAQSAEAPRDSGGFRIIARLKQGVGLAQAREDLAGVSAAMAQDYREYEGTKWVPQALGEVLFGEVRPALTIVLAACLVVLIIACVNVAGLLLVRHLGRRSEIGIRTALGASRFRLARQLMTECLLLTLAGAGAGLLFAFAAMRVVATLIPSSTPIGGSMGLDTRVVLVTLGTAVLASVVFGVFLAATHTERDIRHGMREAAARATGSRSTRRAQTRLAVVEVGLAFVLATAAVLMLRTFMGLLAIDPGFNPRGVFATGIQLPGGPTSNEAAGFFAALTQRVRDLSGVQAAAVASSLPMRGPHGGTYFDIPEQPAPPGQQRIEWIQIVGPDYFRVMQAPLRAGRFFDDSDRPDAPGVVIVNQSFARKYWPELDPLGRRIAVYGREWEIVGAVGDIREFGLLDGIEPVQPLIYFPHAQYPRTDMYLVVRAPAVSAGLIDALRREVLRLAPEQPLGSLIPLEQILTESVWSRRTMAYLMSGFGVLALVLAIAGVYSLLAYAVARRTGELGVRLACGARPPDLLTGILWDGLKTILLGVVLGAVGATFAVRLIASKLYGVSPLDPATFLGVGLLIVVAAIPACYWPARRAAKVDPKAALQCE